MQSEARANMGGGLGGLAPPQKNFRFYTEMEQFWGTLGQYMYVQIFCNFYEAKAKNKAISKL